MWTRSFTVFFFLFVWCSLRCLGPGRFHCWRMREHVTDWTIRTRGKITSLRHKLKKEKEGRHKLSATFPASTHHSAVDMDCGMITSKSVLLLLSLIFWVSLWCSFVLFCFCCLNIAHYEVYKPMLSMWVLQLMTIFVGRMVLISITIVCIHSRGCFYSSRPKRLVELFAFDSELLSRM